MSIHIEAKLGELLKLFYFPAIHYEPNGSLKNF